MNKLWYPLSAAKYKRVKIIADTYDKLDEPHKLLIENMKQDPNEYQNEIPSIKFKLFLRNVYIDCKTMFK